ncbi:MAG: PDZ domain-containing protein [Acidimicrobiia bacterium]|nr:PDZ domain-containing protein [Acidimicrobiia bacterium]MYH06647.1 PDZ domain-containing protein [Acidimicrobiia bacterium]
MIYSTSSRLAKRLLIAALVMGLVGSAPVLAQESPPGEDDFPQPVAIPADDPGGGVTNREAAVLLAAAMGIPDAIWQGLFSDVAENSQDADTIEAVTLAGVVKGKLDGTFRPDEVITRGEFAVLLDRALFHDRFPADPAPFTDIPEDAAYAKAVNGLYADGVVLGCSDDGLRFCGEDPLARHDAESLIERALAVPYAVADCEDPDEWLLFCEVYEHIDSMYLPGATVEELAAPVNEAAALAMEEAAESAAERPRFDCSIPDPVFEPLCAWASGAVDTPLRSLAETAVREMVKALDPNSAYHDPEEWMEIEDQGRYVGIGVRVVTVDDEWNPFCTPLSETCRIVILDVFEGGPAYNAGLMPWDFIVGVDGNRLHGLTLGEAADLIRGEVDTSVDITFERDGDEYTFTLIRKEIVTPYTSAEVHNTESVAYIQLNSFAASPGGAPEELAGRLAEVGDVELLILDLRNNPGGRVSVLQEIAGFFVGEVPVMTFHTIDETYDVDGIGQPLLAADTPRIAVLVNQNSASAAEVLAGLLKETRGAVVIGETTYMKNTGQSLLDLHNKGVFRLTTLKWTTPGGIDIGETGVPLDIETEFPTVPLQDLMEWVKDLLDNPPEEAPEETPTETPEMPTETPEQ